MRPLIKGSIAVFLVLCIAIVAYLYFNRPIIPMGGPSIVFVGQTRSDSVTTIQLRSTCLQSPSAELQVEFEAYLGGRGDPTEFVKGEITNLDNIPSISWENAPTVTEVSIANVPGDIVYGEIWELSFQVSDADYFVDVTELTINHIPSGVVIFQNLAIPAPS